MTNVWIAFGLTVFAGMGTGVGAVIAFFAKRTNYRFLSVATGFSAGVMLYISFVEIFFKGAEALAAAYGEALGNWVNVVAFFGGIALIGLIDNLVPETENPHETHADEVVAPLRDEAMPCLEDVGQVAAGHGHAEARHLEKAASEDDQLLRTGLITALAIGIHNFPEGLVTFLAALQDPGLGVAIAVAIALHNIPEGISVSVPIFYATGERRRAFLYSALSGLAEPVGAMIAYLLLRLAVGDVDGVFPPQVMGVLFAGVAGVMVFIGLDELLPTSRAYGQGHDSIYGLVSGMLVMAVSLLLLG